MLELVYETHATSTDNEAGIATGWGDGRLSEAGRRQAAELGERRRHDRIAAVFSSDLRRAVETAEIAFAGSGIPLRLDARLRECDYGVLNGAPVSRLAAVRSRHVDEPFPGGQSYRQVVAQTRDLLHELSATWDGRRVLLIGHSADRWALQCLLTRAALEELIGAPFEWRPGWEYALPTGWTGG